MSDGMGVSPPARRARVLTPAALIVFAPVLGAGGCGDALEGDRPSEVRVQRVITMSGERVVSYTAMFEDGVETYIDLQPQGSVDLITVERDGQDKLRLVREGASVNLPADGPEAVPLDDAWEARFAAIDGLVSVGSVPWSDGHGGITPGGAGVQPLPSTDGGP